MQPHGSLPELVLRIVGGAGGPVLREMHLPGELIPMSNVLYAMYEDVVGEFTTPAPAKLEHTVDWGHVPGAMYMPMFAGLESLLRAYTESNLEDVRDFGKGEPDHVRKYRASLFNRPAIDHLSLSLVGGGDGSPYTSFSHSLNRANIRRVQTEMSKAGLPSPWDMLGTAALFQVAFLLDMPYLMYALKAYRYTRPYGGTDCFFETRLDPGQFDHGIIVYCEYCKTQFATGTCRACKRGRYCSDTCRDAGHTVCSPNILYVDPDHFESITPLVHTFGIMHGFGHDALIELRAGMPMHEWTQEDHADPFLVGFLAAMCRRAYGKGEWGTQNAAFFNFNAVSKTYPSKLVAQTWTKIGKGTSFGLDFLVAMNNSGVKRANMPFLLQINPHVARDIVKFKNLEAFQIFAMDYRFNSIVKRKEVYVDMVERDWPEGFAMLLPDMDLAPDNYSVVRLAQDLQRTKILDSIRQFCAKMGLLLPPVMK